MLGESIQYLKENDLENLKTELGIKVKEYSDLLVFIYDQINLGERPKNKHILILRKLRYMTK